jgi:hypothetical protein
LYLLYYYIILFKMSNSQNNFVKLTLIQNNPNFELEPLENQVNIFKKKLFSKVLDPIKTEPEKLENYRTVTIKCLYPNCR